MDLENVPRCQHIKVNGTQCGSPALRNRRLCFFHDRIRRERAKIAADVSAPRRFDLPLLEDANAVQIALMKVIQMLGSGRMDHKTAGLMLYALQTASANLRIADLEADDATDVVVDRDTVNATCINGPQWFEEDFEDRMGSDEDTNEEDTEEEADDAAGNDAPAPAEAKPISIEEARMQVKGVIRDWFLTTVCQKPQ
ncbi:MAG: hypothetical protein ABR921_16915 [Candidatus Sulfotelmatobacter sp.]|jgi:hypothetical protein